MQRQREERKDYFDGLTGNTIFVAELRDNRFLKAREGKSFMMGSLKG
jgi:hypothetical protein